MHENQQTFNTGYDIYNKIGNIIYGDNYKNIKEKDDSHDTPKSQIGKSLFEKINQENRKNIIKWQQMYVYNIYNFIRFYFKYINNNI